ncbi:hypothetical protein GGD53_003173 [Rhizobium aethiopicum]|uniref:Uncharacterized protein n=1 Tax=Rhizobium aethiopicum TaxID=1138170 RepID=A0A7W6Q9E5_9HYPH|nr:hypothetical protein [Rhizobium aethiopicum]
MISLTGLCCLRPGSRRLPAPLGFVGRVAILDIEVGVLAGFDAAVADRQFHLITAGRPVPSCRHHRDVCYRLVFPGLQEQDIAGRRHLPRNAVANGDMGNFLVGCEFDLHRRA